jgi:hypothetical protein
MSRRQKRNHAALSERLGAYDELYGLEAIATALALRCDGDAALSRGLRRELALRRMAATLRELGAEAREELDEGLAAAEGRVIGRKVRFVPEGTAAVVGGADAAYGVITAVRKSGIRRVHGAPRLTTNRALRAAGGLTQYDLVEVDVYAADGARLGRDDVPPTALDRYASYRYR